MRCATAGSQASEARYRFGVRLCLIPFIRRRRDNARNHCECKGGWKRAGNAISRTFLTNDSSGQRKFDLPGLSGIYAGSVLMMYWYPRGDDPLTTGVRNGNIAVGVTTGIYLIKEFSPELEI